jgi:hypothetical protein
MFLSFVSNGEKPLVNKTGKPLVAGDPSPRRPWWDKLLENFINALMFGGMAFMAALITSLMNPELSWGDAARIGAIAGGGIWLTEMRKWKEELKARLQKRA